MNLNASRLGFIRSAVFVLCAAAKGSPVILHYHGGGFRQFYLSMSKFERRVIRSILARASRILVLDESYRTQFRFLPLRMYGRIKVVRNGVAGPESIGEGKKKNDGLVKILFLSNLIQSKGYLLLIDALRLLCNEGIPAELHLCGDVIPMDDDELRIRTVTDLKNHIRVLGLEQNVVLHGRVTGQNKDQLLRDATMLALPTKYKGEGVPLCILEAMAWGTPVVATNYRALRRVVSPSVGVLVGYEVGELARAIKDVAGWNVASTSEAAQRLWRRRYSLEAFQQRMFDVFSNDCVCQRQVQIEDEEIL